MRYRLLGHSGLRVSEAALGTMTFGDEWGWGSAKDEARKVYDAFRKAGGNFIDTANFYTNGTSESFLGEFMKDHRQSVVMATKYSNAAPGTDPNAAGGEDRPRSPSMTMEMWRLRHRQVTRLTTAPSVHDAPMQKCPNSPFYILYPASIARPVQHLSGQKPLASLLVPPAAGM